MAKFERIAMLSMGVVIHAAIVFCVVMMAVKWGCNG